MVEGKTQSGNTGMASSWPGALSAETRNKRGFLLLRTQEHHRDTLCTAFHLRAHQLIHHSGTATPNRGQGKRQGPSMLSEQAEQLQVNIFMKRQDESHNTSSRITGHGQFLQLSTAWNLRIFKHRCAVSLLTWVPVR